MLIALTRPVSASLAECELTHLAREPIDMARARAQHAGYEEALRELGVEVIRVPGEPSLPDAVFIEDTAVVVDEVAVITRPGAASRRPETAAVAEALAALRPIRHIIAPGTLDGGDVLVLDRDLYVGRSSRTNDAGIDQLRSHLAPYGYRVHAVTVTGCLHLKSAVTRAGPTQVLVNPEWIDATLLTGFEVIPVDPSEPSAANVVLVNGRVLFPAAYPKTAARLTAAGCALRLVDASELAKAEGALTCCSLLLRRSASTRDATELPE